MKLRSLIAQKFGLDESRKDWQSVHCPFHHDTNASAAINFSLNRFTCSAGCDGRDLKRFVADVKGVRVKKKAAPFLVQMDAEGQITKRSVKAHTVSKQAQELLNFLESRKLSMHTVSMLRGELVATIADPMYGYLVFPFEGGRVGRKILAVEGPRFLTYLGNKAVSNNLKGLLGLENVPRFDDIIVTEGLTDYITLRHLGYENTVCTLGAGLSDYQAYLLRGKTLFFLYDRDYTGFKKARAARTRLKDYGSNSIILELPSFFGEETGKIDVSSAYTTRGSEFKRWLDEQISKYSDSDEGFVSLLRTTESLEYYPSGIGVIDGALEGGFTQGLYGIGGETSVGKSTFAVVLARAFVKLKQRVLYETYELPKRQVWARYASGYSNHHWVAIERDPTVLEMDVLAELKEASNYLKVASDPSIEEFAARARHYPIIIVDYLQSMPGVDAKDVNNSIRLNNQVLRNLSMQGKTVIVVSSVPRSAYGKDDDQSIFKGSGDIEYSTQASIKLARVGDGRIFVSFTKNTRGKRPRGFLESDWQHQLITESNE